MNTYLSFCILLLLGSCLNADSGNKNREQLNQRIIQLEQRIDSLQNVQNVSDPGGENNRTNSLSSGSIRNEERCQAITKRGTQCKRNANNSHYCWQHGR